MLLLGGVGAEGGSRPAAVAVTGAAVRARGQHVMLTPAMLRAGPSMLLLLARARSSVLLLLALPSISGSTMATATMAGGEGFPVVMPGATLTSCRPLLSLLQEDDAKLKLCALQKMVSRAPPCSGPGAVFCCLFMFALRSGPPRETQAQSSPNFVRVQETLVDNNWAEIADHIETIEELYEVSPGPPVCEAESLRVCTSHYPSCHRLIPNDSLRNVYPRTTNLKTDSLLPSLRARCTITWSSLKSL